MVERIVVPKLSKRHISKDNTYQLIIKETYTGEFLLYKVKDLTTCNKLRYTFDISQLKPREYQYYLVANDGWTTGDINKYNISKTELEQEVGALYNEDPILILGDYVLVSGLFNPDVQLNQNAEYQSGGGDIYMKIKILAKGIINKKSEPHFIEYNDEQKFIEYNDSKKVKEYEG